MKTQRGSVKGSVFWIMLGWLWGSLILLADDGYRRQPHLDVVHYDFYISLSDTSDIVRGECTLRFKKGSGDGQNMELDLLAAQGPGAPGMMVTRVSQNGRKIPFRQTPDKVQISPLWPTGKDEEGTVRIEYSGIPADGLIISKTRDGERSFFGDNWPDRARHWLPVVDHPYDKAACRFQIEAPGHYQVVAVGDLVEIRDLPGERRLTVYEEPFPLPTKVMVIGVSRFAVLHLQPMGSVEISSWVYPRDRDPGFACFGHVPDILRFFAEKIGPYPFAKMASVQSKTRYGGMENAGAVFYYEGVSQKSGGSESLIAHELAHQWFGDGVSEADWHHIWLSEGFATYMTSVYTAYRRGETAMETEMIRARKAVVGAARKTPQARVLDPGLGMDQLLSAQSYQKGAWVLHMLRQHLGDVLFWAGIREFYRRFAGRSVLTDDLVHCLEETSGQKLDWFFSQWLERPGFPVLKSSLLAGEHAGETIIRLEQVQPWPDSFIIDVDFELCLPDGLPSQYHQVRMEKRLLDCVVSVPKKPTGLILDPHVRLLFAHPRWEREI